MTTRASRHAALPTATQELVKIRASQVNGCAACTDMHTKDAEHNGETSVRLNLVAVWREATVFTEAERAALELTEEARGSPTGREGSATRRGATRPSTTTRTSS